MRLILKYTRLLDWGVRASWTGVYESARLESRSVLDWSVGTPWTGYEAGRVTPHHDRRDSVPQSHGAERVDVGWRNETVRSVISQSVRNVILRMNQLQTFEKQ